MLKKVLYLVAVAALTTACKKEHPHGQSQESAPAASADSIHAVAVLVTARERVCMVNNTYMPTAQIPVEVDGKTYYGCCEGCKARLARDASLRAARDPVTGRTVDKATAVLGKVPPAKVLYFESQDTLRQFAALHAAHRH